VCQLAHDNNIELFASKRQQKRVGSIELVRPARDERRQEIAFNSRPFVLCGLPIRRPPPGTLRHTRRNGRFRLKVVGHPDHGLPFGQDRLIRIWVATLAVRQKNRTICFRSAAEVLEEFDLPKDGPHYRRLVEGFQRIFASTIFFGGDASVGQHRVWDCQRFHFFDRLRIWCSRTSDEDLVEPKPDRNIISLSEAFWEEIRSHPIPIDARVVWELTPLAGCLDLYMWLCWRCHKAKGEQMVPLFGDFGLASQLGVTAYTRERNFRKRLREWLRIVRLYWPDCPARLLPEGENLIVAPAEAVCSSNGAKT
jgi:hypothetical protein